MADIPDGAIRCATCKVGYYNERGRCYRCHSVMPAGLRSNEQLEAMFPSCYTGWDRGVVVTQLSGTFSERDMTELELAARYVGADLGSDIHRIATYAAFAPITTFELVVKHIGPLFDRLRARIDELDHLFMQPCSGCYEPGEYGQNDSLYPWSEKHHCRVGAGRDECGGTGLDNIIAPTQAEGAAMFRTDCLEKKIAELNARIADLQRQQAAREDACAGHVASENDPKVCGRCGVHIDSLRPPEDDEQ